MHTQRKAHLVATGLAVSLAMAVAGCEGSAVDKAGGRDRAEPVFLTFATNQPWLPSQLDTYPDEVERRSGGTLRIKLESLWRQNEPDQEQGLIADIQAGKADIGWVGARAFDSVGVNRFQALVAPLLVDSYQLQRKVFEAGIPGRMLASLDAIGLAGIGVLPGPMRKMTGTSHAFVKPDDFTTDIVGTSGGLLAEQTFRSLGAIPKMVPAGTKLDGLDGLDYQLDAIPQDGDATVTANLNLWPRPLVLVMNADRFKALTPEQQQILRTTAADEIPSALEATRSDDEHAGAGVCAAGMNVVTATPSDLAALRDALRPVYAELVQDPETNAFLDEIRSLKEQVAAAPESFTCSAEPGSAAETAATPFDGVYQETTSAQDLRNLGDPNPIPENFGAFTLVFDRGRFAFTQQADDTCTWAYGTYAVKGERVEWTYLDGGGISATRAFNRPGEFFAFGWSLYRDTLTLTAVNSDLSPSVFLVRPWHRLDTTPSASVLNQSCPPPPKAFER